MKRDAFREGIELSLEERATAIFRASLRRMSVEQLRRAVAASTAVGTVVEVLNAAPEIGLERETATTRALARGAVAKQEMIQEAGGCLSSGEVARLLGVTVSAVNQRRARRLILAVPMALVLAQPDLGTALIIAAIFGTILCLTPLKLRSFLNAKLPA